MTDRSATTARVPTSRLRPAVAAAMEAYRRERWAKVNALVATEMAIPAPTTWWGRRFGKRPAATREEALARVKAPLDHGLWSAWDEIWRDYREEWKRLAALRDACDLGLDAVDVSAEDVALFKAHYDARLEPLR